MKLTSVSAIALAAIAAAVPLSLSAQEQPAVAELSVAKVALFSSGVAYYERRGSVSGDALVALPFASDEMDDALKSLIVLSGSSSPELSYPSRMSLERALKDFRIDLSGSVGEAELLSRMRGAEVEIDAPQTIAGRIVAVERRASASAEGGAAKDNLVLLSKGALRAFPLDAIQAIRFADKGIGDDFERALELILASRDEKSALIELRLPGSGQRQAAVGYAIAAPVWKSSYRLDLGSAKPRFQGWALVDNPTGQDWKDVSLSLVAGRPVSFIQELYGPLYLERPTLPLAIAGIAAAKSYDSGLEGAAGSDDNAYTEPLLAETLAAPAPAAAPLAKRAMTAGAAPEAAASTMSGAAAGLGAIQAAAQATDGEAFEFSLKKPFSLERGRSAMIPLASGEIEAERVSIFAPGRGDEARQQHPMLGARLANTTGMRLPAGPIAVFDGGLYAGDALLDFFPEGESRLISFGEDLGVLGQASVTTAQETVGVSISKGVMTFARRVTFERDYAFKNSTAQAKKVEVEHRITQGAELFEPASSEEKTAELYRFAVTVPAGGEAKLVVKERSPRSESVALGSLKTEDLLAYSSSQEIPQKTRSALAAAVDLRKKLEDAKRGLAEQKARKESLAADQERYRSNLESVGRETKQGQDYLKRLADAEAAIDQAGAAIASAQKLVQSAQAAYDNYLSGLSVQ
jgi:hypothetical protein